MDRGQESFVEAFGWECFPRFSTVDYLFLITLSSLSNKYTFTYQEMVLKEMITFGAQWSPYL